MMKLNVRDLLLGAMVAVCMFLVLGSNGQESSEGSYEIAASGVYPDLFVVNKKTGEVYRYLFYSPEGNPDKVEIARLESFGTVGKPEYEVLEELHGYKWKGYRYRPMPYEEY